MSGGSYDYIYSKLLSECDGRMYDLEMNDFITDFAEVLHSLEWWQSGDRSEDSYRKALGSLKAKWFMGNRDARLKSYIDSKIAETKNELYDLIGVKNEDD